jgi:nicotinamide-nucleotide amidase
MKIELLLTGDELMAGHIVDSNSAMIADKLSEHHYSIYRKITVGDNLNLLKEEIEQRSKNADVLIINGGLGPTTDDLTAQALAEVTGSPLIENTIALTHLENWCERLSFSLTAENRKQAILPEAVSIIPNPIGSAVGFAIDYQQCLIICTPGVPRELEIMLEQSIIASISERFPTSNKSSTLRLQTFGLGESSLQGIINQSFSDWPKAIDIGFRAAYPLLELKLTIQREGDIPLRSQWLERLKKEIGQYIVGENDISLPELVVNLLQKNRYQLTTAESCTGGLIASQITSVAGASTVFEAGFVTYSNTIKNQVLSVDQSILNEHGAVSEPVVLAMANNALAISQADYAIAVSGIAGPDGGTAEKPVGTVWIAWGENGSLKTKKLQLSVPRQWFQKMVAAMSLDLIRREILGITEIPYYFRDRSAVKKPI